MGIINGASCNSSIAPELYYDRPTEKQGLIKGQDWLAAGQDSGESALYRAFAYRLT